MTCGASRIHDRVFAFSIWYTQYILLDVDCTVRRRKRNFWKTEIHWEGLKKRTEVPLLRSNVRGPRFPGPVASEECRDIRESGVRYLRGDAAREMDTKKPSDGTIQSSLSN